MDNAPVFRKEEYYKEYQSFDSRIDKTNVSNSRPKFMALFRRNRSCTALRMWTSFHNKTVPRNDRKNEMQQRLPKG
uniref:Uncharacterized protein n=1 Tax=Romanomermis culicivorax TaxID=13658 RepID=A0A915L2X6_ROMCU